MDEFTPKSTQPEGPDGRVSYFRDVTIDFRRQTITRAGEETRLRGRSFDVLVYLVRSPGRVVSKQELIEAVWGDVAVSDDSLVQCLVEIRRSLGDLQDTIKTVRGRGYMLDATVSTAPPPTPTGSRHAIATRGRILAIAGMCFSMFVIAGAVAIWKDPATAARARRVTTEVTLNEEARRAYEEGWQTLGVARSQVVLQTARRAFERAVEHDPNFAPAQSALSNTLTIVSVFGIEAPASVLPDASRAAQRAVALAPTHAFGWHALAHSQVQWDRDWTSAEANYRRAQALDPKDINPRYLLAHLLAGLARTDEALQEEESALALEPGSALLLFSKGFVNYLARRPQAAIEAFRLSIEASPHYALPQFWLAVTYGSIGRYDEAMDAALASRREMGLAPAWIVGYVHALAGRRAAALEVLNALEMRARREYVPPVDLALLQIALGNHEAALGWLETGLREHSHFMELLAVLPAVDPLRGHPRFQAILQAMRLPILK